MHQHGKDYTAGAHAVRVLWINKQFHSPGQSPSGTYHQNEIHLKKKRKKKRKLCYDESTTTSFHSMFYKTLKGNVL